MDNHRVVYRIKELLIITNSGGAETNAVIYKYSLTTHLQAVSEPFALLHAGDFRRLGLRQPDREGADPPACRRRRCHFAFSDIRRSVAKAAMDEDFGGLFPVPRKYIVNSLVDVLLCMAV